MKKNKQLFVKIPYKMIDEMTGVDIKYYGALYLHCINAKKTTCVPGTERISLLTNIKSTATLAKAQKNHVKAGWIEKVTHRYENSNEYKIKKVNKQYAEIPAHAMLLSNATFKLYCYLTKKCKDEETTIKTAVIKKESGITDNRTLYPALIELHDNNLLDFPSFVCSKQIHKWKIVKTNPAKTKDPLDKNPAKTKELENTNSAKTKEQPLQKLKGHSAKTKAKRDSFKINFFERNYIMQNVSFFSTEQNIAEQKKTSNTDIQDEKTIINILSDGKTEDNKSSDIRTKQKFKKISNKERRIIRKRYKEQVFHNTGENKNFTKKEFKQLLDLYETYNPKQKENVDSYVRHELLLFDIDPDDKQIDNLIKTFRCEYLVPENHRISVDRTILPDRFKQMTHEERKYEIDMDEVAQRKLKHMERTAGVDMDTVSLQDAWGLIYEKWYDNGSGPGATCSYSDKPDEEDVEQAEQERIKRDMEEQEARQRKEADQAERERLEREMEEEEKRIFEAMLAS